jgi:hypothetical protein
MRGNTILLVFAVVVMGVILLALTWMTTGTAASSPAPTPTPSCTATVTFTPRPTPTYTPTMNPVDKLGVGLQAVGFVTDEAESMPPFSVAYQMDLVACIEQVIITCDATGKEIVSVTFNTYADMPYTAEQKRALWDGSTTLALTYFPSIENGLTEAMNSPKERRERDGTVRYTGSGESKDFKITVIEWVRADPRLRQDPAAFAKLHPIIYRIILAKRYSP